MRYYILESGSRGNCTIIASSQKYLVIDNGLSKKKFKSYLFDISVELEDLKYVLVTHSHSDHTSGLDVFEKEYIYATKDTFDVEARNELIPYETYNLNGFKVTVIPTSHDAKGSIGFIIEDDGEKLVYVTDTGYIYDKCLPYIKDADYYIFESNHNEKLQLKTNRPQYLIDRIMSNKGHLSNSDCALYLSEAISKRTKEIVLAHLSQDANTPEVALEDFNKVMKKRNVDITNILLRCAKQREMVCGGDVTKEIL